MREGKTRRQSEEKDTSENDGEGGEETEQVAMTKIQEGKKTNSKFGSSVSFAGTSGTLCSTSLADRDTLHVPSISYECLDFTEDEALQISVEQRLILHSSGSLAVTGRPPKDRLTVTQIELRAGTTVTRPQSHHGDVRDNTTKSPHGKLFNFKVKTGVKWSETVHCCYCGVIDTDV